MSTPRPSITPPPAARRHAVALTLLLAACGGGEDSADGGAPDAAAPLDLGVVLPDDADQDLWRDSEDNCPAIANPEQRDRDGDGVGDDCDSCPATPNGGSAGQPSQDACDTRAELEPNDTSPEALVVSPAGRVAEVRGVVEAPAAGAQSFDRYQLMVAAHTHLEVRVARTSPRSLLEPIIVVTGAGFGSPRIAEGVQVARRALYFTQAGTYEIAVADRRGVLFDEPRGGAEAAYALSVSVKDPAPEVLQAPFTERALALDPKGAVGIYQVTLPARPKTRVATRTARGTGESQDGLDTILVVERPGGEVLENDDVSTRLSDSRIVFTQSAEEQLLLILDHASVRGSAELEVLLTVDQPATDEELEPNDERALATTLLFPGETKGRIDQPRNNRADEDWFAFSALAGQVGAFHVLLEPSSQLDPEVSVGREDGSGEFLPLNGNRDSSGVTARVDAIFPEAGTYYLKVTDQRNGGDMPRGGPLFGYRVFTEVSGIQPTQILTSSGTWSGQLNVGGRISRAMAAVNEPTLLSLETVATGTPDLEPYLRVYGIAAQGLRAEGALRALALLPGPGSYVLGAHNGADFGSGGAMHSFQIAATYLRFTTGQEVEPNDQTGQESPLPAAPPVVLDGTLAAAADVDRYLVHLAAPGSLWAALVEGRGARSVAVLPAGGATPIAQALDQVLDLALGSGDYVVEVRAVGAAAAPPGYRLGIHVR